MLYGCKDVKQCIGTSREHDLFKLKSSNAALDGKKDPGAQQNVQKVISTYQHSYASDAVATIGSDKRNRYLTPALIKRRT